MMRLRTVGMLGVVFALPLLILVASELYTEVEVERGDWDVTKHDAINE